MRRLIDHSTIFPDLKDSRFDARRGATERGLPRREGDESRGAGAVAFKGRGRARRARGVRQVDEEKRQDGSRGEEEEGVV